MNSRRNDPPWWNAPLTFFVETLVGLFIFTLIALGAAVLDLLVKVLLAKGIHSFIILGLKAAEFAVFGTDLLLFARFLWKTANRAWRGL